LKRKLQVVLVVDGGELLGQCLKVDVLLEIFGIAARLGRTNHFAFLPYLEAGPAFL
jgi:hypothetical protein